MELMACIGALEALRNDGYGDKVDGYSFTLFTDNSFLVRCIDGGWHLQWLEWDWKNKAGQDIVKNVDLWKRLIPLVLQFQVKLVKIAGWQEFHNLSDKLASYSRRSEGGDPSHLA